MTDEDKCKLKLIVLNDDETFSEVEGCHLIMNGVVYSLNAMARHLSENVTFAEYATFESEKCLNDFPWDEWEMEGKI